MTQNTEQHFERRCRWIGFLKGKKTWTDRLETGYDLPAILYNHPDSPLKRLLAATPQRLATSYTTEKGHKVFPKHYGNGLGYDAPAIWITELFQFAIAHQTTDRYSEANVLTWLKEYGPTVWRTGNEPNYAAYQGYEPSGCAGSEFWEWVAVVHYGHPYPSNWEWKPGQN